MNEQISKTFAMIDVGHEIEGNCSVALKIGWEILWISIEKNRKYKIKIPSNI